MFATEDWTDFRSVGTLCRRAGTPADMLRRLVLKELTDNALDAGGVNVTIGVTDDGAYVVQDERDGLPIDPADLAALFSIRRARTSSKLLRRTARGALGNGLRVVAGAVLASGGTLRVTCHGRTHTLVPQDDGTTSVAATINDPTMPTGSRIVVELGEGVPADDDALLWALQAIDMARGGTTYKGKPSPFWYDADAFFELCQASRTLHARELVAQLDGCSGARAGEVAAAFKGRLASSLARPETAALLDAARRAAKPVTPARLGKIGLDNPVLPEAYAKSSGEFGLGAGRGGAKAVIPFVVEAWAEKTTNKEDDVTCYVNRSPVAAELGSWRPSEDRNRLRIFGCNASLGIDAGRAVFSVTISILTPFMPTTTDGKEPDLSHFSAAIKESAARAVRKAKRLSPAGQNRDSRVKDAVTDSLPRAVAAASGDGANRFSQRQLFYSVRPFVLDALGVEPSWGWFCGIVSQVEAERGPIDGMYRDTRGVLYHPHLGTEIPLGTIAAEKYARPDWTFGSVLYCEKEGLLSVLRSAKWPERHDCALMTAKGFATRAAKDVLDLMADGAENVTFFCIHDADAAGTQIYEKLVEATIARGKRKADVVNLGLEPWEAIEMGLSAETFAKKKQRRPVADYVKEHPPGKWEAWLQTNRVELNAMTSPQFLAWLDAKMAKHAPGKVVPPAGVLSEHLNDEVRKRVEGLLTDEALLAARVNERAAEIVRRAGPKLKRASEKLKERVDADLKGSAERHWRQPVADVASEVARDAMKRKNG